MGVWISPFEWQRNAQQIPGLYFVNILDQGRQIMLARMGDRRNREAVFAYGKVSDKGLSAKMVAQAIGKMVNGICWLLKLAQCGV